MRSKYKHIQQKMASDSGITCLKSILQYFGSDASLEYLRGISGHTMLGLIQACRTLGLKADAYEADLEGLRNCDDICILYIASQDKEDYYVIYYGYDETAQCYIISDPLYPEIQHLTKVQLDKIWVSKNLILVSSTDKFVTLNSQKDKYGLWLWQIIKEDSNLLVLSVVLGIIATILGLSTTIFLQQFIDKVLPENDIAKFYKNSIFLVLLLLFKILVVYSRQIILTRQKRNFKFNVIDFLYNLPQSFFKTHNLSKSFIFVNDIDFIQRVIIGIIGDSIIDALILIIGLLLVCSYSILIGCLFAIWLFIIVIITLYFCDKKIAKRKEVTDINGTNESNFINFIQVTEIIKRKNIQKTFIEQIKTFYTFYLQKIYLLEIDLVKTGTLLTFVNVIFTAVIILFLSFLVLEHRISIGLILLISQIMFMVLNALNNIGHVNIQLQETILRFDRMQEFPLMQHHYNIVPQEYKTNISDIFEELKVEHLSYHFVGEDPLLNDISFSVKKGEIVSIIGKNGTGKSIIRQIFEKTLKPESGHISINNLDFDEISLEYWHNLTGILPQQIRLFNGTLFNNITLGDTSATSKQLNIFLETYGFNHFFEAFPNGYMTIIGENGIQISEGQLQLIGLARSLWHNPQLLLLDEPIAKLDNEIQYFVMQLLKQLSSVMGIIILTKSISTIQNSDKIYILENGNLSDASDTLLGTTNQFVHKTEINSL